MRLGVNSCRPLHPLPPSEFAEATIACAGLAASISPSGWRLGRASQQPRGASEDCSLLPPASDRPVSLRRHHEFGIGPAFALEPSDRFPDRPNRPPSSERAPNLQDIQREIDPHRTQPLPLRQRHNLGIENELRAINLSIARTFLLLRNNGHAQKCIPSAQLPSKISFVRGTEGGHASGGSQAHLSHKFMWISHLT
jgi:hypothetical protein